MKRRVRKIANFFAFNLLFFALYLNFIHKDNTATGTEPTVQSSTTAAFSGTVLVENPSAKLVKSQVVNAGVVTEKPVAATGENNSTALKLSIN
ncbi:MAG TPA: hypothetical protein VFO70_10050 [Chitinophagaceae bacterium]|nr:hypothetical protein [Chitinophagaceae bacterium]